MSRVLNNVDQRHFKQNLPKNVLFETESSQSLFENRQRQMTQQTESLAPIQQQIKQTSSLRKISYQKRGEKQFIVKTLELDESGNNSKDLRSSCINEMQTNDSSLYKKKLIDEKNDINHFNNYLAEKDQCIPNNKIGGFSQVGKRLGSPISSIRFTFDKQNTKEIDTDSNRTQNKDINVQKTRQLVPRHKPQKSAINNNDDSSDQFNIKNYFVTRVNKSIDNEKKFVKKSISSRDINTSMIQKTQTSFIQDLQNPTKIQINTIMNTFNSKFPENKYLINQNNQTSFKNQNHKINSEEDRQANLRTSNSKNKVQNLIQQQVSPKNIYNQFINDKNQTQQKLIYKQYIKRITQNQSNVESIQSNHNRINSSDRLQNGQESYNALNMTSNNKSLNSDFIIKKSTLQNIFQKDDQQQRQKKLTDPFLSQKNGNNNVEFPILASNKEQAQFEKLQEWNDQGFSRNIKENNDFIQDLKNDNSFRDISEERKRNKMPINQLKTSSNFFKQSNDSLRIMELIKERNQTMNLQKVLKNLNLIQQKNKQNEEFQSMIQQSFHEKQARNNTTSPFQKNINKSKESESYPMNDAFRPTKSKIFIQMNNNISSNNESKTFQNGDDNNTSSIRVKAKTMVNYGQSESQTMQSNNNMSFNQLQKFRQQKEKTKGSPTLKSFDSHIYDEIEEKQYLQNTEQSKEDIQQYKEQNEKELARYINLVDCLQQQKVFIRENLKSFLDSRPRIVKDISRNCLMDNEQFLFFIMNFIQFCIDDMFQEFKQNYTYKLSSLTSNTQLSQTNLDSRQINSLKSNLQLSNDQQNITFKFSQKIPEEIMNQIVEVIIKCLNTKVDDLKDSICQDNKQTEPLSGDLNYKIDSNEIKVFCEDSLRKFYKKIKQNVAKYIIPQTLIDRIGGFTRLKQLVVAGVKTFNQYINNFSRLIYIEEDDLDLVDNYLIPALCALLNEDKDMLINQINIFKQHKNQLSHYDFFTIKKIIWDTLSSIKLDPKLKKYVILQLENLRYDFFDYPFKKNIKELGNSMIKCYELCNYFRNPNPNDNTTFLTNLLPVLYRNASFNLFYKQSQSYLKFNLNERFYDHLQKFLLDELKETDNKTIMDLQIRMTKLRIRAGVQFNIFSVINEDSETFYNNLIPFLSQWMQKYNISSTDVKSQDFKLLEILLKWCLNKDDYFSIMDSEPNLMHFAVNEFMLKFWLKGIAAYFENNKINKSQYQHIITFISQYLLFNKDETKNEQTNQQLMELDLSPSKTKH